MKSILGAGFLFASVAISATAEAQRRSGDEAPDFRFGAPRAVITLRGGYSAASASSDIFTFFSEDLTIESGDFHSAVLGMDVSIPITSRLDAVVGIGYAPAAVDSQFREFVEDDGSGIRQRTTLASVPFTGSAKLYLVPKGRRISRFAYIANKVRPYVGGGVGLVHYRLVQSGDFVDFTDFAIFTGEFRANGWGLQSQAFGGVDVQVTPSVALAFEGRYVWADAELSDDFVGFDPIDLNALRITFGVGFSF